MSYWITTQDERPMHPQHKNKDKTSVRDGGTIILSKRVKVRKDIREVKKPSKAFKAACDRAGIPPTVRQLGKWNRKRGLAYANRNR